MGRSQLSWVVLALLLVSCHGATEINFNFAGMIPPCPGSDVDTFEYIVVGAGPAGCVVARRLAESGASVLLLEAGGVPNDFENLMRLVPLYQLGEALLNPTFALPIYSEPSSHLINRRVRVFEGRSFGGGSNVYGGIMARPSVDEIAGWGWPGLNATEALSYYMKTETYPTSADFRGQSGPIPVYLDTANNTHIYASYLVSAAANAGLPTPTDMDDGYHSMGVGYPQRMLRHGQRISFFEAYLPEAFRASNTKLTLRSNARVQRVLINGANKAYGVEYLNASASRIKVKASKEVILSAGVAASPQLLMLSGVGPSTKLAALSIPVTKDLPGVGQNYIERPRVEIVFAGTLIDPATNVSYVYSQEAINEWLATGQGLLTKGSTGAHGLLAVPISETASSTFHFEFANLAPFREDVAFPPGIYFFVCTPAYPQSRGEVFLASADPQEPARRSPNFFSDPNNSDLSTLVACAQTMRGLTAVPPLADVTVQELLPGDTTTDGTVGFILAAGAPGYHASSTCKYGPSSDPTAVVNERFAVYGVSNLRVVDASVMPEMTSVNPTLTIAMLAEKAAEVILEDHM